MHKFTNHEQPPSQWDGCQDWTIHHGEQADGKTLIVASRRFLTGDANDLPVVHTGLRKASLLFSYGSCDDVSFPCYHQRNVRKMFIDLSTGGGADKSDFVARLNATSGYSYIDLHFNDATPNADAAENGGKFKTPDAGGREEA